MNLCSLCYTFRNLLPVTDVYDHNTREPWRWGIPDILSGSKSKTASERKGSLPKAESGSRDVKMTDLLLMITEALRNIIRIPKR